MDNHLAFNEVVRQKLDHEHSVMNNKTGWHHVIQIGMFTVFFSLSYFGKCVFEIFPIDITLTI
jgi:hypothetical protein